MFSCDNQWKFWIIFNTLTLKQIFWKTKTFFKKLDYCFLVESIRIENAHFHTKLPYQRPMLRQTEWRVQNGPITKNDVLPVTTLFFLKFCFKLRTPYKELIWCTNDPNVTTLFFWKFSFKLRTPYKELIWCTNDRNAHICTFCRRWSFIRQCFSPVSILNKIHTHMIILPKFVQYLKDEWGAVGKNISNTWD